MRKAEPSCSRPCESFVVISVSCKCQRNAEITGKLVQSRESAKCSISGPMFIVSILLAPTAADSLSRLLWVVTTTPSPRVCAFSWNAGGGHMHRLIYRFLVSIAFAALVTSNELFVCRSCFGSGVAD